MRLTKKGTKLDQVWTGICTECGSEFEATLLEIKNNIKYDRDGQFVESKCTECGTRLFLYPRGGYAENKD